MRSRGRDSIDTVLPDRVHGHDHHPVGQGGRSPRQLVHADEQHVDPLVADGTLAAASVIRHAGRPQGCAREDPCEGVAERRPVPVRHPVRDDHQEHDQREPDDPGPPGGTRANACQGRPEPTDSRRQTSISRLSVRTVPSTAGLATHAASRAGDCVAKSSRATASRTRDGTRKMTASWRAAVEELTKPGEHCRESRCGEAATVEVTGIRPDPTGVHDGRWSSCGFWRSTRAMLPGPSLARTPDMGTPGDRSACQ